ncbi:hypothetical protein MHBO_000551 [Bonamia ostreae]|uniref:Sushi domain-containing protein n=1 Tax=Bonamia ostreae TaxID=126728 RepID=A0ABV2AH74_9EUKA
MYKLVCNDMFFVLEKGNLVKSLNLKCEEGEWQVPVCLPKSQIKAQSEATENTNKKLGNPSKDKTMSGTKKDLAPVSKPKVAKKKTVSNCFFFYNLAASSAFSKMALLSILAMALIF